MSTFAFPGVALAVGFVLAAAAPDIAVFSAALVFAGNLVANVLYGIIDPRIRKGAVHG